LTARLALACNHEATVGLEWVTEVIAVPLLRAFNLTHGYFFPFPNLSRKIALAFAFVGLGMVACASSLVLLGGAEDEPQNAFSLAPLPAQSGDRVALAATAEMPVVDTALALKITTPASVDACQRIDSDSGNANCVSSAKPSSVPRPANTGAGEASVPAVVVASTPPLNAEAESADVVASSASETTEPAKPRKTARHQGSRRSYEASYRSRSARPSFFPFFW
jgi:hypothetical protein